METKSLKRYLQSFVDQYHLDLRGLSIYTEAALGSYRYNPLVALAAGAEKVVAQVNSSQYATVNEVRDQTLEVAERLGFSDKLQIVNARSYAALKAADIVTNSGFVRPIDKQMIDALKPTAVVPLMWETWEFRQNELDLESCKEKGIVVLGTNESEPPCDMLYFIGLTAIKLLLQLDYDGGKVLLLGNAPIPALPILESMKQLGIDVTWVSHHENADLPYEDVSEYFEKCGMDFRVIFIAEHADHSLLLGDRGYLKVDDIIRINPEIQIGLMCGNIDSDQVTESGIKILPEKIAPAGYMSYQPSMLGTRPVLSLFAAGLKVGQVMARLRLQGLSPSAVVEESLKNPLVMDFQGDMAWLKKKI